LVSGLIVYPHTVQGEPYHGIAGVAAFDKEK
jgi:hypothetical protein